jgi:hypothetical protein
MDEDFPLDHGTRVIIFPVYVLKSSDGQAFACMPIGSGNYAVAILTDEDALNRHRSDLGIPECGAVRYDSTARLAADMRTMPAQVTAVVFDPMRHDRSKPTQVMQLVDIRRFCAELEAQSTSHAPG